MHMFLYVLTCVHKHTQEGWAGGLGEAGHSLRGMAS